MGREDADAMRVDFPPWAKTLINATLSSCVLLSLVTILALKEQIVVLQARVVTIEQMLAKDIEAAALRQRIVDARQDSQILALQTNELPGGAPHAN